MTHSPNAGHGLALLINKDMDFFGTKEEQNAFTVYFTHFLFIQFQEELKKQELLNLITYAITGLVVILTI